MSEQFVLARQQTYGDNWPYETKKGWKPKVAKVGISVAIGLKTR